MIIGGGSSGLGIAVDSASRGYKTLLIENMIFQRDFFKKHKTCSRWCKISTKRSISLVVEALREGNNEKNAPHLVRDLSFVIPSMIGGTALYGIGLKIYDMMSGKLGLGPSTLLSRDEIIKLIPNVKKNGLKGGVIYHDGQFDDARMVISLAQIAENHGATLINYLELKI